MHIFSCALLLAIGAAAHALPNQYPFLRETEQRETLRVLRPEQTHHTPRVGYSKPGDGSHFLINLPPPIAGEYQHSEATFGKPIFGGSINGQLAVMVNSTGCLPFVADPSLVSPFILMLERGGCHFSTKVRNAQLAGAAGVVIADNIPLCDEDPSCPCNTCLPYQTRCECSLPILAGDGSTKDISIPSIMVSKKTADMIKACVAKETGSPCHDIPADKFNIIATMSWDMPAVGEKVDMSIWTSANNSQALSFLKGIEYYVPYFSGMVNFRPRYFIYDGEFWGCTLKTRTGEYWCGNQCTNKGKYCYADPEGVYNLTTGLSGSDVVIENARQLCIWQQANATFATDHGARWWKYIYKHEELCVGLNRLSKACSDDIQRQVGIDPVKTQKCMDDAGGFDGDDNTLLRDELAARRDLGIVVLPSVVVNNIIEMGSLEPEYTVTAVCSGFNPASSPRICGCSDLTAKGLEECFRNDPGGNPSNPGGSSGGDGMPGWGVALIIILVLVVIGGGVGGVWYFRRSQRRMNDAIASMYEELRGEAPARRPNARVPQNDDMLESDTTEL